MLERPGKKAVALRNKRLPWVRDGARTERKGKGDERRRGRRRRERKERRGKRGDGEEEEGLREERMWGKA